MEIQGNLVVRPRGDKFVVFDTPMDAVGNTTNLKVKAFKDEESALAFVKKNQPDRPEG